MRKPLMPKATASWLIDNTTLSFRQISEFVELHTLEIQAIADDEVSSGILPRNPIEHGELTYEEIKNCEKNEEKNLKIKGETLIEWRNKIHHNQLKISEDSSNKTFQQTNRKQSKWVRGGRAGTPF